MLHGTLEVPAVALAALAALAPNETTQLLRLPPAGGRFVACALNFSALR
jgi:hypothetical protein